MLTSFCVFSMTIKHIYFQMILFFIKVKMDFCLISVLFLSVHNSKFTSKKHLHTLF